MGFNAKQIMKRMKQPNARELAILCMMEVEDKQVLVSQAFQDLAVVLKSDDLRLAHEIAYGTFRYLSSIDEQLKLYCRKPLQKLPAFVRWALRSGLYQLARLRAPDYAVINSLVQSTQRSGFAGLKGMVNAILRKCQKDVPNTTLKVGVLPAWFKARMQEAYGQEFLDRWQQEMLEVPVRSYWSLEEEESGIGSILPHSRQGEPNFNKRHYAQNESAQAIVEAICRSRLKTVLDYCAAPGGKSLYLQSFGSFDRLQACDVSTARLETMKQNMARLNLQVPICDVSQLDPNSEYDLVLVDAPCSALGIVARHPEIGFLRPAAPTKNHFQTQKDILNQAWKYVRKDGYLFYVVCSPDPKEWPEPPEHSNDATTDLKTWMPDGVPVQYADKGGFVIQPGTRFDGFSGYLIQKK